MPKPNEYDPTSLRSRVQEILERETTVTSQDIADELDVTTRQAADAVKWLRWERGLYIDAQRTVIYRLRNAPGAEA